MHKRTNRNPDHVKRHNTPTINNKVIGQHLQALLTPAIAAQQKYYKQLRLRDRIINLLLMMAAVKRLLTLSYLWTGSINGIKLQVWATCLFYAVLVDLGDASADELSLLFERISLEMVYRGLYHFSVAYDRGKATDAVKYFTAK